MTAFNLSTLTPAQRRLIEAAIARCRYDFSRCLPALHRDWKKQAIDVEFSDLSSDGDPAFDDHELDHGHELGHVHVSDPEGREGVAAHGLEVRHRILGLAWSNGRIELDISLESNRELAHEVFFSELAHEVDWFDPAMDDAGRERIWDAMHDGTDDIGDHGHDWFDVGPYETWGGEAWMGLFTTATSDVQVTLTQFVHKVTAKGIVWTRQLLGIGSAPYFGAARSQFFHDRHRGVRRDVEWQSRETAIAAGRRPCRSCKP